MLLMLILLCRLGPMAASVGQGWIVFAASYLVGAIAQDQPGWSGSTSLAWPTAHLLLALVSYALLRLTAADASGQWIASLPIGRTESQRRRLAAVLVGLAMLLAGYMVAAQPTVLIPLLGLAALGHRWIRLIWEAVRR